MGLPKQFRDQWAKVKRTTERLENAEREFHMREVGYKDEGIYFSEATQARLLNNIRFSRMRRVGQSAELLRLHDRMLESGNAVDPAFNRRLIEGYARG